MTDSIQKNTAVIRALGEIEKRNAPVKIQLVLSALVLGVVGVVVRRLWFGSRVSDRVPELAYA